jgi:hypothetical protein
MDLLATYTHHSELQVITALLLISTLYKSLLQTLCLLQAAVSSLSVPWQRLLTVEIPQLPRSLHCRLATVSQLNSLNSQSESELL